MIGIGRSGIAWVTAVAALHAVSFAGAPAGQSPVATAATTSCFLLWELGGGEIRRSPDEACRERVTPASTFKVAHALAALDAGVVDGAGDLMVFDGIGQWPASARRSHTLGSALQYSVVWYFQRIAERLGAGREAEYLRRFGYGNMDATSGLSTFWIGGSLLITPEEQQTFWVRFYENRLSIDGRAAAIVKVLLTQPDGVVVNAMGEQPFAGPWPDGTVLAAKTGSATDRSGRGVRWLAGHIARGTRSYVFVSCVIGPRAIEANAAIDLAARALRESLIL